MYQERIRDRDESKLAARKAVGALLDINPATLRNWIEHGDPAEGGSRPAAESDELKALRRENAELRRANEILKVASAFFAQAELDRRLK
jgi:transposase-like protein